jgi:uracil-DNA glycosylase
MEWQNILGKDHLQDSWNHIECLLAQETLPICPPPEHALNALTYCLPQHVKVIILGQDPYHGSGEAHGLSFSVQKSCKRPPSLKNIFKELQEDLGIQRTCNDLSDWAQQGVLLLNTVLTVQQDRAGSHRHFGWQKITEHIVLEVLKASPHCAVVLWGQWAKAFEQKVQIPRHVCLCSAHPSPLSAYRGFFGSKPFSKINEWLEKQAHPPIVW